MLKRYQRELRVILNEDGSLVSPTIGEIINLWPEGDPLRMYLLDAIKLATGSITAEEFERSSNAFADAAQRGKPPEDAG